MKKRSISISMLLLSVLGYGQNLPEVVPPSPTVGALMKIEQVPVSNYTGQPNINLPLLSKQISNSSAIGFALNYHTTGIKATEKSGWVGTGWSLQGEAVISRSVVGIPDEYNTYDGSNKKVGVYHNGYFNLLWRATGIGKDALLTGNDPLIGRFLWNSSGKGSASYSNEGAFDKNLDIYQVNIAGQTARFVLPKSGNQLLVKVLSNPGNLKIEPNYNATTYAINYFTVTDVSGTKYILSEKEQTTNTSSSGSIPQGKDNVGNLSRESVTTYISAWKVKEIRRVNNKQIASFIYDTVNQELTMPRSVVTNTTADQFRAGWFMLTPTSAFDNNDCTECNDYNRAIALPKKVVSQLKQTINTKKIRTITLTETGEKIIFNLKPGNHPEYTSGGAILNDIVHQDQFGNSIKKVVFSYSTNPYKRIFLDSYQEIFNGSGTLTHRFNYINKNSLPAKNVLPSGILGLDALRGIDVWGYATKLQSSPLSIYQLPAVSADPDAVDTGALRSIVYPTGGIQEFEFESNTYSYLGGKLIEDTRFKNENPDNYSVVSNQGDFTVSARSTDGYSSDIMNLVISENTNVTFITQRTNGFVSDEINSRFELEGRRSNGTVIPMKTVQLNNTTTLALEPGSYTLRLFSLNNGGFGSLAPAVSANAKVYYKQYNSNFKKYLYGGGIRIKHIKLKGNTGLLSADNNDKTINFQYSDTRENQSLSSGVVDGAVVKSRTYQFTKHHFFAVKTRGIVNTSLVEPIEVMVPYKVSETLENPYISLTQGADVGYQKVFISETGNGFTEYTYSTAREYPRYPAEFDHYPFVPQKNTNFLHGQLLRQRIVSEGNKTVSEVINSYTTKEEEMYFDVFTYDRDDCPYYQFYETYDKYVAKSPQKLFMFDNQGPVTPGPNSVYQNCSDFSYPVYRNIIPKYHSRYLLDKKTTNSYFYPSTGAPVVTTTEENYIYNSRDLVVETTMKNSREEVLSTENKYAHEKGNSRLIAENRIASPIEVKTSKIQGLSKTVLSKQNTTYRDYGFGYYLPENMQSSKGSNALKTRVVYHSYDTKGNPTEVSKKDGTSVVYIWGYHQTKPIAKIEGAKLSDIPFSTIVNLQSLSDNDYDLRSDSATKEESLRSALNNLRNLTVLKDAQVTTFTYDPHVGVTSITDPRGETLYYQYDEFNRLELIKNSDGHIVKEHQYNYKN
ncbi:RHS repeat domain-containing protein [Tenacibaculum sp. 190524A05c]|uniref:YD repeat-containing protein n=1 Tax=Tenacibaculum platacis TaxID=3137852 RepID=A0ABM9NVV9_9FLAO